MVDSRIQKLEDELRARVRRFVADDSKWCSCRYKALRKIREFERHAFLCGGAVRDILLSDSRNNIIPRDLDIVLGYAEMKNIADSFSDCTKRWNCYGGVSIQVKDWSIDMWPLQKTWAFENKYVEGRGFNDFPKTTFLNIEAVAIQLFGKKGKKREIYSKGFFEAIAERTIELNFEENPAPAKCIVRALRIANKFKFVIGPRLARYMISYTNQMEIEELAEIYQRRYMSADVTVEKLHNCFKSIETQMQASNNRPVKVFAEQNSNFFEQPPSLPKRNRDLFAMT